MDGQGGVEVGSSLVVDASSGGRAHGRIASAARGARGRPSVRVVSPEEQLVASFLRASVAQLCTLCGQKVVLVLGGVAPRPRRR